jgi:hypothetical protein
MIGNPVANDINFVAHTIGYFLTPKFGVLSIFETLVVVNSNSAFT